MFKFLKSPFFWVSSVLGLSAYNLWWKNPIIVTPVKGDNKLPDISFNPEMNHVIVIANDKENHLPSKDTADEFMTAYNAAIMMGIGNARDKKITISIQDPTKIEVNAKQIVYAGIIERLLKLFDKENLKYKIV